MKGFPDSPDEIQWMTFEQPGFEPYSGSISLLGGISWVEHPQRERGVDFVAIPLVVPGDALCLSNRALPLVDDISVGVGTDLFIVGFPYGYSPTQPFPVYKRGTVASEPLLPHEGLPYFLIDANTAPGMSGSPVFAIEKRLKLLATREEAEMLEKVSSGKAGALETLASLGALTRQTPHWEADYRLIGIYASRITGPTGKGGEGDYGLGKVWRIEAIAEAFEVGNLVDHPFPPHPVI
nr:serine protease [Burkholderia ubonensis]